MIIMEERLRSLEEQLERVTSQLTERMAALGTSEERFERVAARLTDRVAALGTYEERLERLTAQLTERVAHAAPGTAERVTDVTAQLTEQVSALAAASTEHGTRLAVVERRTDEQVQEWESLRAWWQQREAPFEPQSLMDDRNLGGR